MNSTVMIKHLIENGKTRIDTLKNVENIILNTNDMHIIFRREIPGACCSFIDKKTFTSCNVLAMHVYNQGEGL